MIQLISRVISKINIAALTFALFATSMPALSQQKAEVDKRLAIKTITATALRNGTIKSNKCIIYDFEDETQQYFDVAVRGIANDKCPGDPNISSVIARFRYNKLNKNVYLYDTANEKYHLLK